MIDSKELNELNNKRYENMKIIGTKIEGKEYHERRTVYALIYNNKGEIAIEHQKGKLYGEMYNMIGGKIEEGESPEEALKRETQEELGYKLKNLKYIKSLGCYYYLDFLDIYQFAVIDFYSAEFDEKASEPQFDELETGIDLVWIVPKEAKDIMYFDYHKYFINELLEKND